MPVISVHQLSKSYPGGRGVVDVAGHDPAHETVTFREVLGVQLHESTLPNKMRVGEATVKTNLLHIYSRLGVRDRAAAVRVAYERGVL